MTSAEEAVPPAAVCCEICGSGAGDTSLPDAPDYVTGRHFSVWRCAQCGVAATVPRPEQMAPYYPDLYRRYSGPTLTALRLLYRWRVRSWVRRLPPGRALDVGCGDGWMLSALRERGWKVVGLERTHDAARSAHRLNGIPMIVGELDALGGRPAFDLIILFQALEHLANPMTTLHRCAALLVPGGVLIAAVPNFASWQARSFGPAWFHLDVPRHLHHFSPGTLASTLGRVGLQVTRTRFVSFEHDPYGWVQSALNRLGFRQNLLTRLLMGMDTGSRRLRAVPMMALGTVLMIPATAVAVCSWVARSGAIIEVWAAKK
jgi:SAM-dependent methyltransferase